MTGRLGRTLGTAAVVLVLVTTAGCTSTGTTTSSDTSPAANSAPTTGAPSITSPAAGSSPAGATSSSVGPTPTTTPPADGSSPASGSASAATEGTTPPRSTITRSGPTRTVTYTATSSPQPVAPPSSTPEPAPVAGTCPYITNQDVMYDNGQHTGQTSIIATKPYPVCVFTRSDGGYLATTRIVVAANAAQAAAAVNQWAPLTQSNPAACLGWTGGAMALPNGAPGYPLARSVFAVAKGDTAIIALSNQAQSLKGLQMVSQIITTLHPPAGPTTAVTAENYAPMC